MYEPSRRASYPCSQLAYPSTSLEYDPEQGTWVNFQFANDVYIDLLHLKENDESELKGVFSSGNGFRVKEINDSKAMKS